MVVLKRDAKERVDVRAHINTFFCNVLLCIP